MNKLYLKIIVNLFTQLKKWNKSAKIKAPYVTWFNLMRAGIKREDLEREGQVPTYDHDYELPGGSKN